MYKLCNLISIIISSASAFIALFILEFQAPEHACIPIMLLSFKMQKNKLQHLWSNYIIIP